MLTSYEIESRRRQSITSYMFDMKRPEGLGPAKAPNIVGIPKRSQSCRYCCEIKHMSDKKQAWLIISNKASAREGTTQ